MFYISHQKKVCLVGLSAAAGNERKDRILQLVGILIFININFFEICAVAFRHLTFAEASVRLAYGKRAECDMLEIVKIQEMHFALPFGICFREIERHIDQTGHVLLKKRQIFIRRLRRIPHLRKKRILYFIDKLCAFFFSGRCGGKRRFVIRRLTLCRHDRRPFKAHRRDGLIQALPLC